jgi:Mrp family chromosome partitioning ATPase
VTSPLTSDRPLYAPGTLGAATMRSRRTQSRSLAWSRLKRGARRQLPLALLLAVGVTTLGIAYDITGGVSPSSAALFWAPLGAAAGLALALVNEVGRSTVTSLSSFGRHRGYAVLGAAPELTPRTLRQMPPDRRTPLGCLAFQPASAFATAFRDLQAAISEDAVVAFIAALPEEGATTAALCTAVSAAQQGRNVIVLDCDLRRRTLTRALDRDPEQGVLEACASPAHWQSFVDEEEETGLHFMPLARAQSPWRSLVSEQGFPRLIGYLREVYDLVVLDCPPALGSAEGALLAGLADRCVVVTAWDRTPVRAVRNTMRALHRQSRAATGVYVNRVPPEYRFGRLRGD